MQNYRSLLLKKVPKPETCLHNSTHNESSNSHEVVSLHCAAFSASNLAPSLLDWSPVNKKVRPLVFSLPGLLIAVEISTPAASPTELPPQPGCSV